MPAVRHDPPALPTGRPLVVARAEDPRLARAVAALPSPSVLLTDDADRLPRLPASVHVVEPEALLPDGMAEIADDFRDAATRWLRRVMPARIRDFPVGELLWVDLFSQAAFLDRLPEVLLADVVRRHLQPARVILVGPAPPGCACVAAMARGHGIAVEQPRLSRVRDAIDRGLVTAEVLAAAPVLAARAATGLLRGLRRRRDTAARMAAAGPTGEAALWFALSPAWRQPSSSLRRNVLRPLGDHGTRFGVLFTEAFGLGRGAGDRNIDELSLVDGSVDRLRPVALDQATSTTTLGATLRTLREWLPVAASGVVGVLRHGLGFEVRGVPASRPSDVAALLRVAVAETLPVVAAAAATERFLARHPSTRIVVFNLATHASTKVVDVLLQRAGVTTVDLPHAYVGQFTISTQWRTASTWNLSFTDEQVERYRALATHRHLGGGFAPFRRAPRPPRGQRPRILVAPSYVPEPGYPQVFKYQRRLCAAITGARRRLGDRVEWRLRLHPLDDREAWKRHFGADEPPPLSSSAALAEDLAWCDVFVGTPATSTVEALLYDVPVLLHRAQLFDADTIFAHIPDERRFASGDELVARLEAAIAPGADISVERRLRERCFGKAGEPRDVLAFLLGLVDEEAGISAASAPG